MPAVNSFSHQTGNPLAPSPGSEEGRKEEVGCAHCKEVSSRGQEGAGPGFLGLCRTVTVPLGRQPLGIQFLSSAHPNWVLITAEHTCSFSEPSSEVRVKCLLMPGGERERTW